MGFFDLPPRTLVIIAVVIAYLMMDELNMYEQNTLGNWLQLIGQTLEASSAQMQLLQAKENNNLNNRKNNTNQNNELESRIERLEEMIANLQSK